MSSRILRGPPLLPSFDEAWEAMQRQQERRVVHRRGQSRLLPSETHLGLGLGPGLGLEEGHGERLGKIELDPVLTGVRLWVRRNPRLMHLVRSHKCQVVMGCRLGSGEVVRSVVLQPAYDRCDSGGSSMFGIEPDFPCRLVLTSNKGVTVLLVSAPVAVPVSVSSEDRGMAGMLPAAAASPMSSTKGRSGIGVDSTRDALRESRVGGKEVFLRCCWRFNHELVQAALGGSYLYALTLEGMEVWTLPPEEQGGWEACGDSWEWVGDRAQRLCLVQEPFFPKPFPRPCLLHIQALEVDGQVPQSPP
ncbi:unnamed protein product, partial [Discosporangium mesarthrocarpum]